MRIRVFGLAAAAVIGVVSLVSAQAPPPAAPPAAPPAPAALASPPAAPGMTAIPPVAAPAPAPIVVQAPAGCGTPAPCAPAAAPCAAPAKSCSTGKGLLDRLFIGCGTASSPGCSSFAAERSFQFSSCSAFYAPCKSCNGTPIEYGPGGLGNKDNCKHVTSFLNR